MVDFSKMFYYFTTTEGCRSDADMSTLVHVCSTMLGSTTMMNLVLITLFVTSKLAGFLDFRAFDNPIIPCLVKLLQYKMELLVEVVGIRKKAETVFRLIDIFRDPAYQNLALFRNPKVAKMIAPTVVEK